MIDESTYGFLFSSNITGHANCSERTIKYSDTETNIRNNSAGANDSNFNNDNSNLNTVSDFINCNFRTSLPSIKESFNCCLTQPKIYEKSTHFSQDAIQETNSTNTEPGFIIALSLFLTQIATSNSSNSTCNIGTLTPFHSVCIPPIPIRAYLVRIAQHFGCSNECFVLAIIYVGRIIKFNKTFTLTLLNVHRVIVTAIMLATKFFDDVYYSNAFYAKISGVGTRELNSLEIHFLRLVKFQLFVTEHEYEIYKHCILKSVTTHSIIPSLPASTFNIQISNKIGKYNLFSENRTDVGKNVYVSSSYNSNYFSGNCSSHEKYTENRDSSCNLTKEYATTSQLNCMDNFYINSNSKNNAITYSELSLVNPDLYDSNYSLDNQINFNLNLSTLSNNFSYPYHRNTSVEASCCHKSGSFQSDSRNDKVSIKHELKSNRYTSSMRRTYKNSPFHYNNQVERLDSPSCEYKERSCRRNAQYPQFLDSTEESSTKHIDYLKSGSQCDNKLQYSLEHSKFQVCPSFSNYRYFQSSERDILNNSPNCIGHINNTGGISFLPKYDLSTATSTAVPAVNPTVNHYGQHLFMNSYNLRCNMGFDRRLFV